MKKTTEEWLNYAEQDLKACSKMLEEPGLTNIAAFHAQQAIEKSLKAIIEEFEVGFIKSHDLIRLYEKTKPYLSITLDENILLQINELYLTARYPGDIGLLEDGKPSDKEANSFYLSARDIYEEICKQLNNK